MCNISCITFGAKSLTKEEVKGKRIIEVGSRNISGSLRPIIEALEPRQYVGIDIEEGPGVDIVCDADKMLQEFGRESFDVVISTELLEHIREWRKVISNIKNVCKPNGIILITTRSRGFGYHGYPHDYWRYEVDDMENIFSDCEILALERDSQEPGVFIKARRPDTFIERDLADYQLYSIVVNRRAKDITGRDFRNLFFVRQVIKGKAKKFILRVGKSMDSKI